jgi:hypothetical protein
MVFWSGAAETQQFYISNGLKKPNRVPIRQFVNRIQQLKGYLDLLACLYYSNGATKLTKEVELFNDVDLASHIYQWSQGTGKTSTNSWEPQYPRVFTSCSKHLSTLIRPS